MLSMTWTFSSLSHHTRRSDNFSSSLFCSHAANVPKKITVHKSRTFCPGGMDFSLEEKLFVLDLFVIIKLFLHTY